MSRWSRWVGIYMEVIVCCSKEKEKQNYYSQRDESFGFHLGFLLKHPLFKKRWEREACFVYKKIPSHYLMKSSALYNK